MEAGAAACRRKAAARPSGRPVSGRMPPPPFKYSLTASVVAAVAGWPRLRATAPPSSGNARTNRARACGASCAGGRADDGTAAVDVVARAPTRGRARSLHANMAANSGGRVGAAGSPAGATDGGGTAAVAGALGADATAAGPVCKPAAMAASADCRSSGRRFLAAAAAAAAAVGRVGATAARNAPLSIVSTSPMSSSPAAAATGGSGAVAAAAGAGRFAGGALAPPPPWYCRFNRSSRLSIPPSSPPPPLPSPVTGPAAPVPVPVPAPLLLGRARFILLLLLLDTTTACR